VSSCAFAKHAMSWLALAKCWHGAPTKAQQVKLAYDSNVLSDSSPLRRLPTKLTGRRCSSTESATQFKYWISHIGGSSLVC
jgi:hypothetical protein